MSGAYKGSIWRKWDLHIHSNASPDSNLSPSSIVDKLIDSGISVFSITDHSTSNNIDEFYEIVDQKNKNGKEIHFLPGVELKTDKGDKSVHLIGVFPNFTKNGQKVTKKYLYDELLSQIGCTEAKIKEIGKEQLGDGKEESEYFERGQLEVTCNLKIQQN